MVFTERAEGQWGCAVSAGAPLSRSLRAWSASGVTARTARESTGAATPRKVCTEKAGARAGVSGSTTATNQAGVIGMHTTSAGFGIGALGGTLSTDPGSAGVGGVAANGTGVLGISVKAHGVRGVSQISSGLKPPNAAGVWGDARSAIGVYGSSLESIGVLGV